MHTHTCIHTHVYIHRYRYPHTPADSQSLPHRPLFHLTIMGPSSDCTSCTSPSYSCGIRDLWRPPVQLASAGPGTDTVPPSAFHAVALGDKTAEKHQPLPSASYIQLLKRPKPKLLTLKELLVVSTRCSLPILIPFSSPFLLPSFIFSPHVHSAFKLYNTSLFFPSLHIFYLHHFPLHFPSPLLTDSTAIKK